MMMVWGLRLRDRTEKRGQSMDVIPLGRLSILLGCATRREGSSFMCVCERDKRDRYGEWSVSGDAARLNSRYET